MAVAISSVNTQNSGATSGADKTLTFPSATYGAGEVLVVVAAQNSAGTGFPVPAAPSGGGLTWTQIVDVTGTAGNFVRSTAWWATTGAGGTYSVTQTTAAALPGPAGLQVFGALYRLTGANTTTPVGATDTHQGTATDPLTSNTNLQLTTATLGSILFAVGADWSAQAATVTMDSGLTVTTDTNVTNGDATYLIFRSNALAGDDSDVRAQMDTTGATGNWAAVFFEIEAPTPVDTVQQLPSTDEATNSWTNQAGSGTNIFQAIDETAADDTDYVQSALAATSGSYYETKLTSATDPALSTDHVLHYRYRASPAYASTNVTVSLRQGAGTQIATATNNSIGGAWTDANVTLTGGEADAITDYSDLRIRIAPTGAAASAQTPARVANTTLTASNLTTETATTVTVDSTAAAAIFPGHYMIAAVAVNNSGASGARPGLTVTDSRSHTWTVTTGGLQDPGAANAGAACYIAYTKVTTAYVASDTITFTWGAGDPAAKSISVAAFAGIHQTVPVAVTETTANAGSTAFSLGITPSAANQLVFAVGAIEGPSGDTWTNDADSTNGSWTAITEVSTGNTGATDITLQAAFKAVSASGAQTWNSTITSRDWCANAIVFAPDAAGSRVQVSWANLTVPVLVGGQDLAGQSDGIAATSADVVVAHSLAAATGNGVATTTAALAVAHTLVGQADGVATTTAAVTVAHTLAGQADGTGTATGDLIVTHSLAGTSPGAATTSADLAVAHSLAGQSDGTSSATGGLGLPVDLEATADGTSTTAADLIVDHSLAAQSDGAGSTTADLIAAHPLVGQSDGTSSTTAAMVVAVALAAASDGTSTASGALDAAHALVGTSDGTSSATGDTVVTHPLAGQSDGTSTADATLSAGAMTADSAGTSTATGDLVVAHPLAAASDGASTAAGSLSVAHSLDGSAAGTGDDSASLAVARPLAATSDGASTATGALSVAHSLAGSTDGTSTTTGATTVSVALVGSSSGTSTADGSLTMALGLAGTSDGSSTATATLNVDLLIAGTASGTSTATGTLRTSGSQFFSYGQFLEYVRGQVATATGRDTYLSAVTEGERPSEPFCVIHAFGPTGPLERAFDGQATALSFYLQVDGIGRHYGDALWMLDRAVAAIRALPAPSYVNDLIVLARSSAFEINSEALRAVGQRMGVRLTRA